MTAAECLRDAAQLETMAQQIYRGLAERYADRPELRDLFTALSEEEALHAERIRKLSHEARQALDVETGERIGQMLRDLERELSELAEVAARPGDRPEDILLRVVEFESRFAVVHAEHLAEALSPESRLLFLSLSRQDRHHVEMIEQVLRLE